VVGHLHCTFIDDSLAGLVNHFFLISHTEIVNTLKFI